MAQLVFSDTSNYQGILQEIERMTKLGQGGITGTTALLQDFTRLVNIWDGRINTDILLSDGKWQYDDFNIGDMPIATTQINSGQYDYSLRTDDNGRQIWKVSKVRCKDSSGNWKTLTQIDNTQLPDNAVSGTPEKYDLNGISIILTPTPNYTLAAALEISFKRESKPFATSGTDSQAPGFASAFHYLLALGPAYEYARDNGLTNANALRVELEQGRAELKDFYASRNAQQHGLRAKQENTR